MDASNMLKPALMSGKLRVMGSTTYQEFRGHLERDRALVRRFQKIEINEPSHDDSVKILRAWRRKYEEFHKVSYQPEALEAAVGLSERYLQDKKLPDKAIDLIDEAGAAAKLEHGEGYSIGASDIETIVAKMAQIPPKQVYTNDKESLRNLESELKSVVLGKPTRWTSWSRPFACRARACAARKSPSAGSSSRAPPASARPSSPSSWPRSWASSSCAST